MKFLPVLLLLLSPVLFTGCDSNEPTEPPTAPRIIRGDDSTEVDQLVEVLIVSDDPQNKSLTYEVNWGDGRPIDSYSGIESSLWFTISHHFFRPGTFSMRCRAVNADGRISGWSSPFSIVVLGTAVLGRGDWWMFMRDPQHSGHSPFAGPSSPLRTWRVQSSSPIRSSAGFDAAGTMYVGGDDFLLRAIYADGSSKWMYNSGSSWIRNAPAIAEDGSVFFGSSSANIYRLAVDGTKVWNVSVNAPILRSNAVLDESGSLYIGSTDNSLYCLGPDGSLRWRKQTNGPIDGSPALSPDGKTVYVASRDQIVYAFGNDGALKWSYPTDAAFSGSPSVGPTSHVYIGNEAGWLYAFRPDGTPAWIRDLHSPIITTPAATRDGYIHVMTSEGKLYRFDNEGTMMWVVPVALAGGEGSPVVDINSVTYVGTPDGQLTAVSAAGAIRWKYTAGGPVHSTPSIGPDGSIAFGSDDGVFQLLGER